MNCIIIEDEVPAQDILTSYIKKIDSLELIGVFNSPLKSQDILSTKKVDLIFLDINLPNISGLSFLKSLSNPPSVIMTTAYSNYAVESFEQDAIIDYLVKPISFERFLKAINKAESINKPFNNIQVQQSEVTQDSESIFINVDKTLHKIKLEDIRYVQSDRNYVTISTKQINFSFIDTLKKWGDILCDSKFIQVHKSYIINIEYIEKVTGNIAYIDRKEKIPIGRTFKEPLFSKIKPIN
ncbi:LytR/AlgR family response regulator transcription factor [Aestuariivivens insulae]|uniref:LytR/AlgR family response regulator transcription factor n=1 Tax=Aestuariivivens insulae TaxID=1621988 RepID=UPI001F591AF0|nr:LytTR family DNA-binding domain-containing protein [Aestuariivivens insulae]